MTKRKIYATDRIRNFRIKLIKGKLYIIKTFIQLLSTKVRIRICPENLCKLPIPILYRQIWLINSDLIILICQLF